MRPGRALGAAVLALGLLLAGCGGASSGRDAPPTTRSEDQPHPSPGNRTGNPNGTTKNSGSEPPGNQTPPGTSPAAG